MYKRTTEMRKYKAVFLDIDGTLVSFATHRVSPAVEEAIGELRASGVKVFIATGRMLAMLNAVEHIEFDGYVTYNGACCTDRERQVIYSDPIPKHYMEALRKRLEKRPFPVAFMAFKEMLLNYEHPSVEWLAEHINIPRPRVAGMEEIMAQDVYQLCVFLDEAETAELLRETLPECAAARWIPLFADVNMKHINKGAGIDHVISHFGIDISETMAFGDGGNDIPMLRHAAVGVAMGNATKEVQAAADYTTGTVDEDGIVQALLHYGML